MGPKPIEGVYRCVLWGALKLKEHADHVDVRRLA
jgi:hypothetical protein